MAKTTYKTYYRVSDLIKAGFVIKRSRQHDYCVVLPDQSKHPNVNEFVAYPCTDTYVYTEEHLDVDSTTRVYDVYNRFKNEVYKYVTPYLTQIETNNQLDVKDSFSELYSKIDNIIELLEGEKK